MPSTIKKILHWLFWGFIIYAVVANPDRAADIVRAVWDIISQGVINIGRFFDNILNG